MTDFSPTKIIDELNTLLRTNGDPAAHRTRVLLSVRRRRYTNAANAVDLPAFEFSLVTPENATKLTGRARETILPAANPAHVVRSEYAFISGVVVSPVPLSEFQTDDHYAPPFVLTTETAIGVPGPQLSAIPIRINAEQTNGVSSPDAEPGNPLSTLGVLASSFVNADAVRVVLAELDKMADERADMEKPHPHLHSRDILPSLYGLSEAQAGVPGATMRAFCALKQRSQKQETARTRHVLEQLSTLNASAYTVAGFRISDYLGKQPYFDAQGFYVPLETSGLHTFDDVRTVRDPIATTGIRLVYKTSTGAPVSFSIRVPCYLCVVPGIADLSPGEAEFDLRTALDFATFPALGAGAQRDALMPQTLSEIALRLGALLCGVVTVSTFWRTRSSGELPTAWAISALRKQAEPSGVFARLCDAWLEIWAGYVAYNILFNQSIYDYVDDARLIFVHNAVQALVRRDDGQPVAVSNPRPSPPTSGSRSRYTALSPVNNERMFSFLNAVARAYAAYYMK